MTSSEYIVHLTYKDGRKFTTRPLATSTNDAIELAERMGFSLGYGNFVATTVCRKLKEKRQ